MTNRKKLRARYKAAKRRRAQQRIDELIQGSEQDAIHAKRACVQAHIRERNAREELDRVTQTLSGRLLLAIEYTAENAMMDYSHGTKHRLQWRTMQWIRGKLMPGEVREMQKLVDERMTQAQDYLAHVRRELGASMGIDILKDLQPQQPR